MKPLRIGTRDSQLAVWQAAWVQELLKGAGVLSELVYLKTEGDVNTVTPLYALGVTGIFTRTLDAALLNNRIDIAVHSMKDVPTQLAQGIRQAAVLKRASPKDILVYRQETDIDKLGLANGQWPETNSPEPLTIGTGSIRRIAQWLNRFPHHRLENLRGNVNTRLRKLQESTWHGAIFAAAGLERIGLRPSLSVDLDWMLPAPAQGAIMIVCRDEDRAASEACASFNDEDTALCTRIERDFLSALMGGCSTPISGLATVMGQHVHFTGNVVSPDGRQKAEVKRTVAVADAAQLGAEAAKELLNLGGRAIVDLIRSKGYTTDDEV